MLGARVTKGIMGQSMDGTVRNSNRMLALMNPRLGADDFVFCTTTDAALAAAAGRSAIGRFDEDEGVSLILERGAAEALGFAAELPMKRIVLMVNSALDGVGLMAAVASGLAAEEIPCNVVAAFHHDHIFVPAGLAERALTVLKRIQTQAVRAAEAIDGPGAER